MYLKIIKLHFFMKQKRNDSMVDFFILASLSIAVLDVCCVRTWLAK